MARGSNEVPFIYLEAKPKRGNHQVVDKTIYEMMDLFARLYEKRANCRLRTEQKGHQWTLFITYEKAEDRDILDQHERFQELLTDLRVFCKPAHRFRRKLYAMLHPGQRLGIILSQPVRFPK